MKNSSDTNNTEENKAIVILGATATGKTSLAVKCAEKLSGEIISADSRQVYKELNLGAGKDLDEYGEVKYHLIDICDLNSEYNVFNFQKDCFEAFEKIKKANRLPIIAGGTGLYLSSVLQGYKLVHVPKNPKLRANLEQLSLAELAEKLIGLNPNLHNKTDLEDRARAIRAIELEVHKRENSRLYKNEAPKKIEAFVFRIDFPRAVLRERIRKRLDERIKQGMLDEVKSCIEKYGEERILKLGLEYKHSSFFLRGDYNFEEYFEKLYIAICQFAKRQETWFRKMEREGVKIISLKGGNTERMLNELLKHYNGEH
ncbi:MAG: tRNA (adenosine(37)-N6)-dimethylallyltransferase MiaA [Treponemataceae bacterium]